MADPFDVVPSQVALGILIATSGSLVGLLAVWAASSPRHWFLRTAVVAGVLLLAVPIPAYEPMLAFLIQAIVVAGVLAVIEARRDSRPHFSLATLLLLVAIAAVAFAVGARIPEAVWAAWLPVAGIGICLGSITLLATWAALGRRRRSIRAVLLFAVVAIVSFPQSLAIARLPNLDYLAFLRVFDEIVLSSPRGSQLEWKLVVFSLTVIWAVLVAWMMALLISLGLILGRLVLGRERPRSTIGNGKDEPSHTPSRWATPAGLALALLTLAMLLPSAAVYWPLVNPTPKPKVVLPSPNAYDDLVQVGTALLTSNVYGWNPSQAALKSEVTKHAAALAQAHAALDGEFRWPLTYTDDDIEMPDIQAFRQIARAFRAEASVAMIDGRIDDAVRIHVDRMRLGLTVSKDGILAQNIIGIAVNGIGTDGLIGLRDQLTPAQAKELVARLETLPAGWEPMEDVMARERVWSEHAYGWVGRLGVAMEQITGESIIGPRVGAAHGASDRRATQMQLLIADFAVRGYQKELGELPEALSKLVPDYLSAVPHDPYGDGPLTYRLTDDGYLLYSIWQDGDDDGGRSVSRNELWSDGDFLVDTLYQPTPFTTGQTRQVADGADAAQDQDE